MPSSCVILDRLLIETLSESALPGRRDHRRWMPLVGVETESSAPKRRRAEASRSGTPFGCVAQCFLYPGFTTDE